MTDRATLHVLRALGAALSTLHQAHRRGAAIRIEARPGEPWTVTVDATSLGGRLWTASSSSLTQLITSAHGHILADVSVWAVPAGRRAAHQAVSP